MNYSLEKENYLYDYIDYTKNNSNKTTHSDIYRSSASKKTPWTIIGNKRSDFAVIVVDDYDRYRKSYDEFKSMGWLEQPNRPPDPPPSGYTGKYAPPPTPPPPTPPPPTPPSSGSNFTASRPFNTQKPSSGFKSGFKPPGEGASGASRFKFPGGFKSSGEGASGSKTSGGFKSSGEGASGLKSSGSSFSASSSFGSKSSGGFKSSGSSFPASSSFGSKSLGASGSKFSDVGALISSRNSSAQKSDFITSRSLGTKKPNIVWNDLDLFKVDVVGDGNCLFYSLITGVLGNANLDEALVSIFVNDVNPNGDSDMEQQAQNLRESLYFHPTKWGTDEEINKFILKYRIGVFVNQFTGSNPSNFIFMNGSDVDDTEFIPGTDVHPDKYFMYYESGLPVPPLTEWEEQKAHENASNAIFIRNLGAKPAPVAVRGTSALATAKPIESSGVHFVTFITYRPGEIVSTPEIHSILSQKTSIPNISVKTKNTPSKPFVTTKNSLEKFEIEIKNENLKAPESPIKNNKQRWFNPNSEFQRFLEVGEIVKVLIGNNKVVLGKIVNVYKNNFTDVSKKMYEYVWTDGGDGRGDVTLTRVLENSDDLQGWKRNEMLSDNEAFGTNPFDTSEFKNIFNPHPDTYTDGKGNYKNRLGKKTIGSYTYILIASVEDVGGIYKHVQRQVTQRKKSFSPKDFENAEYLVEIISYKNKPKGTYKRPSLISLTEDETKEVLTISIQDFVKFQENVSFENQCIICADNIANCKLPCSHEFCEECLKQIQPTDQPNSQSSLQCPVCREPFDLQTIVCE